MIAARDAVLLTTLTVAALGSWYLARQDAGARDDIAPVIEEHRGFYLKTARILGTAEDGDLLYEIRADSAEQEEEDSIRFTDVSIRYSPNSDVPWTVAADNARIFRNEQRLQLSGNVQASSLQGFAGNDTEIRTQYLILDPENTLAETPERVQIRIGTRSLTATGMLASFKDNTLELKSNVSGKFAP